MSWKRTGLLLLALCRGASLATVLALAAYGGQRLLVDRGWALPDLGYTALAATVFGVSVGYTIQSFQRALKAEGIDWPKRPRSDASK